MIAVRDWNAAPLRGDDHPVDVNPPRIRRKLNRRPAHAIEEVGFIDVGFCLGDDTPTVGHSGRFAYRCDRIYTTMPPAAMAGHKVIEEAHPTSDHRPVIAWLDLHANSDEPAQEAS